MCFTEVVVTRETPSMEKPVVGTTTFTVRLPSPEILKSSIGKILASFDDIVQVELMKTRWEEIKKLNLQLS